MRRSQQYKLNWHFDGSEPVLEEYIDGSETDENHGNLAERFGLLVYSQNRFMNGQRILQACSESSTEALMSTNRNGHRTSMW